MPMPNFFTSPYFVMEPDNWHLKEGAPEEVKKEFAEFMGNPDCVVDSSDSDDE